MTLAARRRVPYTGFMLYRLRRHPSFLRFPILILAVSLLFTQGLRLCLHAPETADAGSVHTTMVHLETDLLQPGPADDATNDRHVHLGLALVKPAPDVSAFAASLSAILILPFAAGRFAFSHLAVPVPPPGGRARPPLRAPPR